MASIEDILIARAMKDQEDAISPGNGAAMGAGIGALGGLAAGQLPHMVGNSINRLTGRKGRMFKPGSRMAGGLVGAIVGGGLGAGMAALAQNESPAARILAKIQSGQQITPEDRYVLENVLAQTYSNLG